MGKPFQSELEELESTLYWVLKEVSRPLAPLWLDISAPVYAVGSGGSLSAADLLARLVRDRGGVSYATTPLEVLSQDRPAHELSMCLISASGGNKDIINAAKVGRSWECKRIRGLTAKLGSPLADELRGYSKGDVLELPVPSGKDGFLATNSLVAMMGALAGLLGHAPNDIASRTLLSTAREVVLNPVMPEGGETSASVIILYAGWSGPAAIDLESKLSEAALAPAMLCDLRSFGHGRHHWLAKRPDTLVVALVDDRFESLFRRTLSLLPKGIQTIVLRSTLDGPWASLDLTLQVFGLVRDIGRLARIDPGRPGVPEFGRKLYHLAPSVRPKATDEGVERRLATLPTQGEELRRHLVSKADEFRRKLSKAEIRAVVFDYDGTLVDSNKRFGAVHEPVARELNRLLEHGVLVGIATGRGKSVRQTLRAAIFETHWPLVLVGYYNGAEMIGLSDDRMPDAESPCQADLAAFYELATYDIWVKTEASVEVRPSQLTFTASGCANDRLFNHVARLLMEHRNPALKCVASSHSVDVLPLSVSKRALITECMKRAACSAQNVLAVGDSGLWPGNDSELLSHFPSVSSGSSPIDLETGWNLAPLGTLEAAATRYYLERLVPTKERTMKVKLK